MVVATTGTTDRLSGLSEQLLVQIANLVAMGGLREFFEGRKGRKGREAAEGLVERVSGRIALLRSLNAHTRQIMIAQLRPALALVMRVALRETVSTRTLFLCMDADAELRKVVLLQSESGAQSVEESAGLLSRLVDLSESGRRARAVIEAAQKLDDGDVSETAVAARAAARAAESRLEVIVRLIESAKPALYTSLAKATVLGGLPMYFYATPPADPMEGLAGRVIERLKTVGPYKPIENNELAKRLAEFLNRKTHQDVIRTYGPLCLWDVSELTDFTCAFESIELDSDLFWNTQSAVNMKEMFHANHKFKGYIGTWNVSNVNCMRAMFADGIIEDSGIGNWNTGSLTDAYVMFARAKHLSKDLDLSGWAFGPNINMVGMFHSSNLVDGGIGEWDVATASTNGMLRDALNFTGYKTLERNWPKGKCDSAGVPNDRKRDFGVDFGSGFGSVATATTPKMIARVLADALRSKTNGAQSSEGGPAGRLEGRPDTGRRQKGQKGQKGRKGEETCAIL